MESRERMAPLDYSFGIQISLPSNPRSTHSTLGIPSGSHMGQNHMEGIIPKDFHRFRTLPKSVLILSLFLHSSLSPSGRDRAALIPDFSLKHTEQI